MPRAARRRVVLSAPRSLAVVTVTAVAASLLVAIQAPASAAQVTIKPAPVTSAPDLVSAQAAARAQNSKVLVDNLTTETDQTWANADGSLSSQSYLAVMRKRQTDGSWADVDLTLARGASSVAPVVSAVPMSFGVAGSTRIASATVKGLPVSVGWEAPLPEPTLSGTIATYPNVRPGVDLQVQALRTGFEVSFVVKIAPAAPLSLPLTYTSKGLSVTQASDGSLVVTDTSGAVVSRGATPVMFGAAKDTTTDLPVKSRTVTDSLSAATSAADGSATRTWTMMPDPTFFADPTVTYPVTVDPAFNTAVSSDTYVSSAAPTTSYYSATHLYIGMSTGTTARTLLHVNAIPSQLAGMYVDNAYLQMFNSYSGSCAASQAPISLNRSGTWTSGTTWNTQPSVTTLISTSYFAHNGPLNSCGAAAYDNMDITGQAQAWADGTDSSQNLRLSSTETTTLGWKEFNSSEAGSGVPRFYFTYRAYPQVTSTPAISPAIGVGPTGYWLKNGTPTFSEKVTSSTGSYVQGNFMVYNGGTLVWSALGNTVTAGGTSAATVPSSANLQPGVLYTLRVWGVSGGATSPAWSPYLQFKIDTQAPSITTVSSTAYPVNTWTNGVSSGPFTFAATDDQAFDHYLYGLDTPSPTTSATSSSVTLIPGDGWHVLYVRAVDKAGNTGAVANYPFGASSAVTSPLAGTVSQQNLSLAGASGAGGHLVSFYWRRAGTDPWALVPVANVTRTSSPAFAGVWPYDYTTPLTNGQSTPALTFDLKTALSSVNGPAQIGVCLGTSTACPASPGTTLPVNSSSTTPIDVSLDTNAFNAAATSSLGPVGVNLLTGNTQVSAGDVTVPGTNSTSLSIGRVLNTATVASTPGNAALGAGHYLTTGVFGPGWTASLPVDSAGSQWTGLVDTGSVLTLQGPDQTTVAFTPKQGGSTVWLPTGDAIDSGLTLTVDTSSACTTGFRCYTLTDPDNVTVVTQALLAGSTLGTLTAPVSFGVKQVTEPGVPDKTSFTSSGGLVTRVLSPIPSVTGTVCDTTVALTSMSGSNWTTGCRGLALTYGDGTTGKPLGQLKSATYLVGTSTGPLQIDVGCWLYDVNNRLTDEWDPRNIPTATAGMHVISCGATPLRSTHYDYDGSGRISKVTPAWNGTGSPIAGTTVTYDGNGRLSRVDRTHLTGHPSGAETSSIAYGVPLTPDGANPQYRPDLTNPAAWGQLDVADGTVGGTVICPPGAALATATGDLRDCTITYLDTNGRAVNTVNYSGTGGSGWHFGVTEYDTAGRTVRTLDAANREEALSPTTGAGATLGLPADPVAAAAALSTISQYGISAGDATHPADGQPDMLDTYGPYHAILLSDGVTAATARAHTHYVYDSGSETGHPSGSPLHLVTSIVTGASRGPDAVSTSETDQRTSSKVYAVGSDTTGWTYRTPLETITDPAGLNLVSQTVLDPAAGRVLQTRMPKDVASASPGTTSGTTISVYYSANAISGQDSDCGNQVLLDGMLCKIYPADLAAGGSTAPSLITTKTSYDVFGRALSVTETPSGDSAHVRTSNTIYGFNSAINSGNSANPYASATQQTTLMGGLGTALPTQTTTFDTTTALPTVLSDGSTEQDSTFDDYGRLTSFNENPTASAGQANVTTITYDPNSGRVTSSLDQHQRNAFTYNSTTEHRGLITAVSTDVTASNNSTALWTGSFTAGYDSDGRVITQTDPNAITSTLSRDEAGQLTKRADTKSDGTEWLTDAVNLSVYGQQLKHTGPAGAQHYSYDAAGRLSTVEDIPTAGTCATRSYGYDADTNRLTRNFYGAATDGSCSTAGAPTTVTSSYDTADRLLTVASASFSPSPQTSTYDSFGRTTTAPAATLNGTGGANMTVGYFANDLVASQSFGTSPNVTSQTWTLDPTQARLRAWITTVNGTVTASRTNHYDGASGDSPAWIAEVADGSSWTTNVTDLIGGLSATVAGTSTTATSTFQYANIHGDIQATASNNTAATIGADVDEFGNEPAGTAVVRYGWLGGHQRSDEDQGGLVLMGVRLYNALTGRFLSTDPQPGGSANSYDYCSQDPINSTDLDGQRENEINRVFTAKDYAIMAATERYTQLHPWKPPSHHHHHPHWWESVAHVVGDVASVASTVVSLCPAPQCAAVSAGLGVLSAGAYYVSGDHEAAVTALEGAALGILAGGVGAFGKFATGGSKAWRLVRGGAVGVVDRWRGSARSRALVATLGAYGWMTNDVLRHDGRR